MTLLVDLFGYLSIIIHGLTIAAQSVAIGSTLFLIFAARPLSWMFGTRGDLILRGTVRLALLGAAALIICELATVALQVAVLMNTVGLPLGNVLRAGFALAGLAKAGAALLLALTLGIGGRRAPALLLLPICAAIIAAAVMTTHAVARLEDRELLAGIESLHLLGAAIWIGGIPAFLSALARLYDRSAWELIGKRFSRMSMIGVACILGSGVAMSMAYIAEPEAFYGTAYGVMVGAKIAMFAGLLLLGFGNFRVVHGLAHARSGDGATAPVMRMRRFAEVEIGVGFTVFFAAASLTSVPPAVDLTHDRVTWTEIAERNAPYVPRLTSPDHDSLTLPALQQKLDEAAAHHHAAPAPAFIPGSGEIPARNANDIAWSEYNHHWAGIFVILIGLLALANQARVRAARHWPLLFLALAAFLFVRSDPEVWPLGQVGFFASLRDVEVLQHRIFVLLIIIFGLFEWRVRAFPGAGRRLALVFPIITAIGAAGLLTHTHAIANIKEQLLIEVSHTPLALLGITAAWSRWLEIRLPPPGNRRAGWVWPVCFVLVGVILIWYREA